jgi:hypothetical protein
MQVRAIDECAIIKATALSWFNTHRMPAATMLPKATVESIDKLYQDLLSWCEHATVRAKYKGHLTQTRDALIAARSATVVSAAAAAASKAADQPPNFAPLIPNANMQAILTRRWVECVSCLQASAPLAATVMMGGLLEAILLARVHHASNKSPIFSASGAPKDSSGKTKPLNDWTLKNYIDVAHELKWIGVSAKSVGEVLRDYRNYIHPHKELSHAVTLLPDDAILLWEVSKTIARQLLKTT